MQSAALAIHFQTMARYNANERLYTACAQLSPPLNTELYNDFAVLRDAREREDAPVKPPSLDMHRIIRP